MEEEKFLTGYCRQINASRMVEAVLEDGHLSEADCGFGACPFESVCTIAAELRNLE